MWKKGLQSPWSMVWQWISLTDAVLSSCDSCQICRFTLVSLQNHAGSVDASTDTLKPVGNIMVINWIKKTHAQHWPMAFTIVIGFPLVNKYFIHFHTLYKVLPMRIDIVFSLSISWSLKDKIRGKSCHIFPFRNFFNCKMKRRKLYEIYFSDVVDSMIHKFPQNISWRVRFIIAKTAELFFVDRNFAGGLPHAWSGSHIAIDF